MKKLLAASALATFASWPAVAAAPDFQTPAPIAYMLDMSSGAVLYSKDPDRRMPPASMAKMMTVYVAFGLLKSGQIKANQLFDVRPETWQ
ncbi:MAG: serine hydrolase, partial [Sphingomonas sp.]